MACFLQMPTIAGHLLQVGGALFPPFVGEPGLMQVFLQGTYSKPLRSGLTVVSVQGGKEIKPP